MPDQQRIDPKFDSLIAFAGKEGRFATTHVTESKILLVENVIAQRDNGQLWPLWEAPSDERTRGYDLAPFTYGEDVYRTPEGEVPTIAGSKVEPRIVRWCYDGNKIMHGSAQEQHWRKLLNSYRTDEVFRAEKRAEKLLLSMLDPQQRIDYLATRRQCFFVKGKINRLYRVIWYGGLEIVKPYEVRSKRTGQTLRTGYKVIGSICFHPDVWFPAQDIMLMQKLMIENDEANLLTVGNVSLSQRELLFLKRRKSTSLFLGYDGKPEAKTKPWLSFAGRP